MVDVSLFRPGLRGRCHAEAGAERAGLPGGRPGTYGPAMSLTPEEIERYARHLVLADIGGPGQAKLKAARVLVIGAGGLGAPLLQYLAAAGVGTIGIVDDDVVSLSNLQRQVIHASRGCRPAESRERRGGDPPAQPACRGERSPDAAHGGERPRPRRRLRCGGGRIGQFRHPLRRLGRVLLRAQAAGDGGARPVRRLAHDDPRP